MKLLHAQERMSIMKIVIIGNGKVGRAIVAQLSREGHDLLVVDSNATVLRQTMEQYDVMGVHGNGASLPIQREAGVDKADLLIAATSADEINLLTCILAKRLGAKHTIARVRNPEYSEQLVMLRDELGLSMTVNPELAAATEAFHILQLPSFLHRDKFAKGRVEIVELRINEKSRLKNVALSELYRYTEVRVLVCAVERKGEAFIPGGDFVLQENDKIHVTADSSHLVRLILNLGLESHRIRNVMIIGGSRISYYLAKMLLAERIAVKIIERDAARCIELADRLPEATIIEGDGNSQRLLLEEGIRETDALVTLTNMDEENIFLSLYGTHIKVPKVITKISQTEYADIIQEMGIESAISPKLLTATEIVRYVRAMSDTAGGAVITMHELVNGKVEALEFLATSQTRYLNEPLTKAPIKKGFLIACIFRRNRIIIPTGSDSIRRDDTVIIVTANRQAIVDLNDIFEA